MNKSKRTDSSTVSETKKPIRGGGGKCRINPEPHCGDHAPADKRLMKCEKCLDWVLVLFTCVSCGINVCKECYADGGECRACLGRL